MKFQYQRSGSTTPLINNFESSLSNHKYYFLLNGSFGDILEFLIFIRPFARKSTYGVVIFTAVRWADLVKRFVEDFCEIFSISEHHLLDLALSESSNNLYGPAKLGKLCPTCITCFPNLPEMHHRGLLTKPDFYRFLLNVSVDFAWEYPEANEKLLTAAKTLVDQAFCNFIPSLRSGRRALVSFSNNSNLEVPGYIQQSVCSLLKRNGLSVAQNVAPPAVSHNFTPTPLSECAHVDVPAVSACEVIDEFDYFVTGINGLQTIALIGTRKVKIIVLTYKNVATKLEDWNVEHDIRYLRYCYSEYDTTRLTVLYLDNLSTDEIIEKLILSLR